MKKSLRGVRIATLIFLLATLGLAGCGTNSSTKASSPSVDTHSTQNMNTNTNSNSDSSVSSTNGDSTAAKTTAPVEDSAQNIYMVIEPGAKLGPDGKMHDAYINGDIKITKGQKVTLNILNYDGGSHTYTSTDLGLNIKVKGSEKKGVPSVTQYTFTPDKEGTFAWYCADPCDGEANGWAMTHDGYMKGHITVLPETNKTQYISLIINAGFKLGSDGKLHDSYTPGDMTVKAGQPVELTVYNFDGGTHTFTSKDLNVNLQVKGNIKDGEPSTQTVTFTVNQAGKYQWNCMDPCDGENNDWAMTQDGYMMGFITAK